MFVLHLCIYRGRTIWGVSSLHLDQSYVITRNPYHDEKWFIGQGLWKYQNFNLAQKIKHKLIYISWVPTKIPLKPPL